jgi:hypothetical protein
MAALKKLTEGADTPEEEKGGMKMASIKGDLQLEGGSRSRQLC